MTSADRSQLEALSREYLYSEVDFVYGRFLHDEVDQYLETDRAGRGRGLTQRQRESVLRFYHGYFDELMGARCVDAAEIVRIAYRLAVAGQPAPRNYGAVIVDEVQDLSELSLRLLHRIVGSGTDGLLLVGDSTQRIFTRGFSMTGLGIDIAGRSVVLRKNYRNTRQILEGAFPLVAGEWEVEAKSSGLDHRELRPEFSEREGPRPIIVRCGDVSSELAFVAREVKFLLRYDRYQPRDICVMARNKEYRRRVLDALITASLPARDYEPRDGEDNNAVRVSTLHNSKGHEFAAVFICGMVDGVFPPPSRPDDSDVSAERALLYVGMTRARDIVYLSLSDAETGGRMLRPSSLLTSIGASCDWYRFRR
jgi:superfamily I DNA/RNA helicase